MHDITRTAANLCMRTIASTCQIDQSTISEEDTLDALGLDSMGVHSVISRLEAELGIELSTEQILQLLHARSVCTFIDHFSTFLNELRTGMNDK